MSNDLFLLQHSRFRVLSPLLVQPELTGMSVFVSFRFPLKSHE
jgi:hypothetical protein